MGVKAMQRKEKKDMVSVSMRIPKELWKKIKILAVEKEKKLQELMREALEAYVRGEEERKRREGRIF